MITLSELCDIQVGRTPPRADPAMWGKGVPWLSIADMSQGNEITHTKEQVTQLGAAKGKLISPGTVLLSFKLSIGKVAIAKIPMLTNEAIAALPIKDPSRLNNRYLLRILETMDLAARSNRAAMGATLNKAKLRSIRIPLPPLDEQRRIAAILDQADAIRTKRRDQLDRLGNLVSSIFLDMFGDPVSNPRQLPTKALGDIGSLDRGVSKHRPRNDPLLLGGAHPLIQTGDVASADRYINSYHSTYSDMGLAQSRMWPAGTLCITIAANIAKTGILKFDSCFPDSIVGFLANRPLTMYVAIWLDFLQKTIEASAPQSAQKNINLRILRSLELPVPPEEELSDFLTRVTRVDSQRSRVEAALARDDELFASLQSRAFKGEL